MVNRYFVDLIYTEKCRKGIPLINFQCQARIYIIAQDEEDAKNRLGIFFNRPINQFTYTIKKVNSNLEPDVVAPGDPFVIGR